MPRCHRPVPRSWRACAAILRGHLVPTGSCKKKSRCACNSIRLSSKLRSSWMWARRWEGSAGDQGPKLLMVFDAALGCNDADFALAHEFVETLPPLAAQESLTPITPAPPITLEPYHKLIEATTRFADPGAAQVAAAAASAKGTLRQRLGRRLGRNHRRCRNFAEPRGSSSPGMPKLKP